MLSLGAKLGDYIVIGDNIKIYVIKQENNLRFAIDAPKDVRILRGDVYEQMMATKANVKDEEGNAVELNYSAFKSSKKTK